MKNTKFCAAYGGGMETTMKNTIGQNIAFYRKKVGLTQEELSEKMNVTSQAVSKWENDLSYPDPTAFGKLAKILETTADNLLNGETELPNVSLSETEKPEKRLLVISVNMGENAPMPLTVNLRIPAQLVLKAYEEGSLAALIGDRIPNEQISPEEAQMHAEKIMNMGVELLKAGTVGPIIDMDANGTKIRIEVIDYEN